MKKMFLLLILLWTTGLAAQSPLALRNLSANKQEDASTKETSVHNFWFGSKLTSTIGSEEDLSDRFLFNGKIVYDLKFGDFSLPVVSSVDLKFDGSPNGFLFGDKGVSIGVQPYKVVSEGTNSDFVVHGGLIYKLLPQATMKLSPQQTKIFAGIEWQYYAPAKILPLSVTVTPAYQINNLINSNMVVLETTVIMPLSNGFGVLAELITPFKSGFNPVLRFGVINKLSSN